MIYLKHVNLDFKKQLETKYGVCISLVDKAYKKSFNIVIMNCPSNLLPIIDKEIKDECAKKIVKSHSSQYFPGLGYVVTKKNAFKNELLKISST